jgi:ketosteroid isomerase-like protein
MKTKLLVPAFMALSVTLFACDRIKAHEEDEGHGPAAAKVDLAAEEAAVRKVEGEMLAAFKAKDSAKLGTYYAEDAVASMPGRAAASGRAAIGKLVAEDMKDPAFAIDFANAKTAVAASGDLAYTRGTFRVAFTDPQTKKPGEMIGNYVTVFGKQSDGSWKAVEDIASQGGAATPAAGG